jgi:hypothetical protein
VAGLTGGEAAQLVVRAGEAIVCPGCGEVLVVFKKDAYGLEAFAQAAQPARVKGASDCRWCGEWWGKTAQTVGSRPQPGIDPGPRIYLRSGTWTGWRAIGGE